MKYFYLILIVFFFYGCIPSSQSVRLDNPSVLEGNELLLIGEEYFRRNKIDEAENYFKLAYERFNRVDFIKGKINSLLKLSFISSVKNEEEKSNEYYSQAKTFENYLTESDKIIFLLTNVEIAKIKSDNNLIINLTDNLPNYDFELETAIQLLSYRANALLNVDKFAEKEINGLLSLESKIELLYNELQIDASVYSLLLETIAYYYYEKNELNNSLIYFDKAKSVNGHNENYLAVAGNLYYKGLILEKTGNLEEAKLLFKSSYEIFENMKQKIKSEYALYKFLHLSLKAGDTSSKNKILKLYQETEDTRLKEEINKILK